MATIADGESAVAEIRDGIVQSRLLATLEDILRRARVNSPERSILCFQFDTVLSVRCRILVLRWVKDHADPLAAGSFVVTRAWWNGQPRKMVPSSQAVVAVVSDVRTLPYTLTSERIAMIAPPRLLIPTASSRSVPKTNGDAAIQIPNHEPRRGRCSGFGFRRFGTTRTSAVSARAMWIPVFAGSVRVYRGDKCHDPRGRCGSPCCP